MRTVGFQPLALGVLATALSFTACAKNRSDDASASPQDTTPTENTEMLSDPDDDSIPPAGEAPRDDMKEDEMPDPHGGHGPGETPESGMPPETGTPPDSGTPPGTGPTPPGTPPPSTGTPPPDTGTTPPPPGTPPSTGTTPP